MSVFISDKDTAKLYVQFLAQITLIQKILKPFNKFAVLVLSSLKQSAAPRVLNLIKHCYSFIKHYIMWKLLNRFRSFCDILKNI